MLNGYVIAVENDKFVIGISDYLLPEKKIKESIKHLKLIVQRCKLDKIGLRHIYCCSCPQHRSPSTLIHLICNQCNGLVCDCVHVGVANDTSLMFQIKIDVILIIIK